MSKYPEDVMVNEGPGLETLDAQGRPGLVERLLQLQSKLEMKFDSLESEIPVLEREYSTEVYAELIYLLSHLRFDPAEAQRHWQQICEHRDNMQGHLGQAVDLRVALISYFLDVNRQLENPKIIEMKLFERTLASADRDGLTGLYNYRVFREHLAREVYRGERNGWPLSLIMLDIDNFKDFNDQYGHEAGNEALREIADLMNDVLKQGSIAARYGGEEFAAILPSTTKITGTEVAERLRQAIEQHRFPEGRTLTVSLGVATLPADAGEANEVVRHADQALYVSKAGGRNQVTPYGRSRRSYRRVDAVLEGRYRQIADESYPLTTSNVSEAGLSLQVDRKLGIGSLIEIRLDLKGSEVGLAARVVGVDSLGEGLFRTAVLVTDISTKDRNHLLSFIRGQNSD